MVLRALDFSVALSYICPAVEKTRVQVRREDAVRATIVRDCRGGALKMSRKIFAQVREELGAAHFVQGSCLPTLGCSSDRLHDGADALWQEHVADAVNYRMLDRRFWSGQPPAMIAASGIASGQVAR